jgi:membrane-associated phospholipid phosphatase
MRQFFSLMVSLSMTVGLTSAAVADVPNQSSAPATPGSAKPNDRDWYSGAAGRRRILHLSAIGIATSAYFASETVFKSRLAAVTCRWCTPPGIDDSIRNNLVWSDVKLARTLADLTGYAAAPAFALGAVWIASIDHHGDDGHVDRWLDDGIPIIESLVFAQIAVQAVKFGVGRQRPLAHYAALGRDHAVDDNLSFISGHSALVFSVATSAGLVAYKRGYSSARWIFGVGYGLAVTTAYLRIAGDKHYFTDVVGGSLAGAAFGAAVPLLLHSETLSRSHIAVTPTSNGVSVSGVF